MPLLKNLGMVHQSAVVGGSETPAKKPKPKTANTEEHKCAANEPKLYKIINRSKDSRRSRSA